MDMKAHKKITLPNKDKVKIQADIVPAAGVTDVPDKNRYHRDAPASKVYYLQKVLVVGISVILITILGTIGNKKT